MVTKQGTLDAAEEIAKPLAAVFLLGLVMYSAVRVFLYATLAPFGLQRIVSFSILCDLYRNDANGTNPFLPFFLEAIEKGTDPVERQYLVHLLCSPPTNRNVSIVVPGSFLGVPSFQGESLALRNASFRASTSHGTGADGHSLHHPHEEMHSLRRYSSRVTNLISSHSRRPQSTGGSPMQLHHVEQVRRESLLL